jgi:hypothetical protein
MPKQSARPPRKRKPTKSAKPTPNYELIDRRRDVREQRELVKLTRKLRRDQATYRRELRMLWMDLTRQFAGKFPDELGLNDGEPPVGSTTGAFPAESGDDSARANVVREHARA